MSLSAATGMEENHWNKLRRRTKAKVDLGVKLDKTEKDDVEESRSIAGGELSMTAVNYKVSHISTVDG